MTKAEEIMVLRNAIDRLGRDSYVGPWLESVVYQVEDCIKSDFPPENFVPTIPATREEAARMIEDAARLATKTIEDAKRRAGQIEDKMRERLKRHRVFILEQLEKAAREIRSI